MRDRLPVEIENLELPKDNNKKTDKSSSYGYVSFLYILSMVITTITLLVVLVIGNR